MAEWLRRGLQILARRFDSGSGLHLDKNPPQKEGFALPEIRIAAKGLTAGHFVLSAGR